MHDSWIDKDEFDELVQAFSPSKGWKKVLRKRSLKSKQPEAPEEAKERVPELEELPPALHEENLIGINDPFVISSIDLIDEYANQEVARVDDPVNEPVEWDVEIVEEPVEPEEHASQVRIEEDEVSVPVRGIRFLRGEESHRDEDESHIAGGSVVDAVKAVKALAEARIKVDRGGLIRRKKEPQVEVREPEPVEEADPVFIAEEEEPQIEPQEVENIWKPSEEIRLQPVEESQEEPEPVEEPELVSITEEEEPEPVEEAEAVSITEEEEPQIEPQEVEDIWKPGEEIDSQAVEEPPVELQEPELVEEADPVSIAEEEEPQIERQEVKYILEVDEEIDSQGVDEPPVELQDPEPAEETDPVSNAEEGEGSSDEVDEEDIGFVNVVEGEALFASIPPHSAAENEADFSREGTIRRRLAKFADLLHEKLNATDVVVMDGEGFPLYEENGGATSTRLEKSGGPYRLAHDLRGIAAAAGLEDRISTQVSLGNGQWLCLLYSAETNDEGPLVRSVLPKALEGNQLQKWSNLLGAALHLDESISDSVSPAE